MSLQQNWMQNFVSKSLFEAPGYKIDTPSAETKLDQNEIPFDWPLEVKKEVLSKVESRAWNRYPESYSSELIHLLSQDISVPQNQLLISPGSNYHISLLLSLFRQKQKGKLIIARPSFALYEAHAKYYDLPYETWELDQNFRYSLKTLPPLEPGSTLIFASPNGPTGGGLPRKDLSALLEKHPDCAFIADEAYYEFSEEPYLDLCKKYQNLILIRTFSKVLASAGVRLGYTVANPTVIEQLQKLNLPFINNIFAVEAAKACLSSPVMKKFRTESLKKMKDLQAQLYSNLSELSAFHNFEVFPSETNFILLRWESSDDAEKIYQSLIQEGIIVRNVSKGPRLAGCLRISVGLQEENNRLIQTLSNTQKSMLSAS